MRVRTYEVFFGHLLIFSVGTVLLSVVGEKTKTIDWLRGATCPPELDQCWEPARSALRQCYLIHLWVYWRAQRGTKLFRSEGCPKNNWFQLSLGTSQCRYHWLVLHILLGKLLGGMTCILGSGLPLWINHLVQNQAWVFRVLESMLPLWRLGSPCCLVIEGRKHFFGGKAVIGVGTSLAKGQTSLIRQIINKDSKIWYYIIEKKCWLWNVFLKIPSRKPSHPHNDTVAMIWSLDASGKSSTHLTAWYFAPTSRSCFAACSFLAGSDGLIMVDNIIRSIDYYQPLDGNSYSTSGTTCPR